MVSGVDWNDAAGTLTVISDLSACVYGNGNGVSGSGYFCDILFETRNSGASPFTLGNGTLYRILSGNISAVSGKTWVNNSAQISRLYGLNTSSFDGGSVTAHGESGPYTYDCGAVVNMYADPDPCYDFVNWTGTPRLLRWIAWTSSEIVPSYWINVSVAIE